ncbi:F-box domain, FBD domain, Leucine-rich repeat domain, L domain-like protein [Artemisia annua]|uniref:F-box domain, FBD domain, Leucine-rich repeat domain, L domain-like protein n=1 Tax=Artemisia annua TaxID=35608 RepID=A0A2U1LI46_ARTAN|nr:F-box domain, FBD domain, Leucine-rich repeat domain, L domain-like protein [Artemisia annua]
MRRFKQSRLQVDRVSNLPDRVIHSILSRLESTEEAVRTSVLSTRWRYMWTSIPSIDIDCSRQLLKPGKKFKKNKFKMFVYWVLLNKTLDLDSFRLCCSNYYNMSTLKRWIHAASIRKVKKLHLSFFPIPGEDDEAFELPHSLVTCASLEVLSLFLFRQPLVLPYSTKFRGLRVLELNSVEFYDEECVEAFLVMCPSLEDLSFIDCVIKLLFVLYISSSKLKSLRIDNRKMMDHEEVLVDGTVSKKKYDNEGFCNGLEISCPALVSFEYGGDIAENFDFKNLDSLRKAVIHPNPIKMRTYLGDIVAKLFVQASHLESLSINRDFVECEEYKMELDECFSASLPNLKTLELTTTINDCNMNVLIHILKCSPNLESLNLIIQEGILRKNPGYWEFDEAKRTRILTRHLKRVEFLEFNGEKEKLDVARILLEQGNALGEMVFSWRNKVKYREKSAETMNMVSKFIKASSFVKLITLLKDSR